MSDLITRLLLNTQQFDQNLGKSSQQIQGFQQKINTFSSGAVGAFTKFAGVVGLAMGGMEAFNKIIGSTQTTADLFGNNMVAAKETVNAFFVSLNSGDWNAFSNGIIDAYKNMKDLAEMMDELQDKRLSLIFTTADNMKDLAKYEEIIKDPNSTQKEKIDAAQNYSGIVNYQAKKTMDAIASEKAALIKNYSSRSGMNIDLSDLTYFASNTNADSNLTNESIAKYKESLRLQKEYEKLKKAAEYDAKTYGNDPSRKAQKEFADLKKVSDEYYKQNQFMIKQGFIANESDKSREALYKTLTSIRSQEEGIYQLKVRSNKLSKTAHKGDTDDILLKSNEESKITKDSVATPLVGSIAYDRALLKQYQKQLEETTDEGIRKVLRGKIYWLELNIKSKLSGNTEGLVDLLEIEEAEIELTPVMKPSRQTRDTFYDYKKSDVDKLNEELELSKAYLEELKDAYKDAAGQMQDELSNAMSNVTSLEDALKIATVKKDIEELSKSLNDSLYGGIKDMASSSDRVVSAFSNLRSVFEDIDSSSWDKIMAVWNVLTTSADSILSVIDTINKVTEIINKLTAAKQAGAIVDTAVTATEVSNAGISATTTAATTAVELAATSALTSEYSALAAAKTFAAHASLPFIGTGIASGLIATQQAIINAAKLPKFADGGIISGSSFVGDNLIARVNSGEMILNGTQQRNLFNLLDGKGGSIGSSASVEFKISGKDLVGTLNNQMSKTNKYK